MGECYVIENIKEFVHIGSDLPDEYSNSNYIHHLKGVSAKAKANATQGLPEMIQIATQKQFEENRMSAFSTGISGFKVFVMS